MTYPTQHPFINNPPSDPANFMRNLPFIQIYFSSPGAAQEIGYNDWIARGANVPFNWGTGTAWALSIPTHWTGTCLTGLQTLYVAQDGTNNVYSGSWGLPPNGVYRPNAFWPGGYIFQDLPKVRTLGVGVNVAWNGFYWACSVSFTDFKHDRRGINGNSGGVYPNNFGAATTTPQPPYYSIPQFPNGFLVISNSGSLPFLPGWFYWVPPVNPPQFGMPPLCYGAQTGTVCLRYVSGGGLTVVWPDPPVDLVLSYELFEFGGNLGVLLGGAPYTFPMWQGSAFPFPAGPGEGQPPIGLACLPNTTLNELVTFPIANNFSQVSMSNGYSLYVWALAA